MFLLLDDSPSSPRFIVECFMCSGYGLCERRTPWDDSKVLFLILFHSPPHPAPLSVLLPLSICTSLYHNHSTLNMLKKMHLFSCCSCWNFDLSLHECECVCVRVPLCDLLFSVCACVCICIYKKGIWEKVCVNINVCIYHPTTLKRIYIYCICVKQCVCVNYFVCCCM